MNLSIRLPNDKEWICLAQKFGFELSNVNCQLFIQILTKYFNDDIGLFCEVPNSSDENFHIVKKESAYFGYIGHIAFFKEVDLLKLIVCGIGLHVILQIELPERMLNTTIFLSQQFDFKLWRDSDKKKPKLPNIIKRKLEENRIV